MEKGLAFLLLLAGAVTAFSLWCMTYTFTYGKPPFDIQPLFMGQKMEEEKAEEKKKDTQKYIDNLMDKLKDDKAAIDFLTDLKTKVDKEGLVIKGEENKDDTKTSDAKSKIEKQKEALEKAKTPEEKEKILTIIKLEEAKKAGIAETLMLKEAYIVDFYNKLMEEKVKNSVRKQSLDEKENIINKTKENVKQLQAEVKKAEDKIKEIMDVMTEKEKENVVALSSMIAGLGTEEGAKLLLTYENKMIARILTVMTPKSSTKIISSIIKEGDDEKVKRINEITNKMRKLREKI